MEAALSIICTGEVLHLFDVPVIEPIIEDGVLMGGLVTSEAHFCKVCEASTEIVYYKLG